MAKNFDLIYEDIMLESSGLSNVLIKIKREASILEEEIAKYNRSHLILTEDEDGAPLGFGSILKNLLTYIVDGVKNAVAWSFDMFKTFLQKLMEIPFVRSLFNWLLKPVFEGCDFLKKSCNINLEEDTAGKTVVTISYEDFKNLVEKASEAAKEKEEETESSGGGFFSGLFSGFKKILKWIFKQCWGLVKIISVAAAGYFLFFKLKDGTIVKNLKEVYGWIKEMLFKGGNAVKDVATNLISGSSDKEIESEVNSEIADGSTENMDDKGGSESSDSHQEDIGKFMSEAVKTDDSSSSSSGKVTPQAFIKLLKDNGITLDPKTEKKLIEDVFNKFDQSVKNDIAKIDMAPIVEYFKGLSDDEKKSLSKQLKIGPAFMIKSKLKDMIKQYASN